MILITGAAGFIGSALVADLNRKGVNDLVLCDSPGQGEKWKNLAGLKFRDLLTPEQLLQGTVEGSHAGLPLQRVKTVVHLGACAVTTETNMDYLLANNTHFSQRLCLWALERDAQFIYASSAAVYGDGSLGFSDDPLLTPKLRPLNAYGFSKWLFDMWVIENGLYDRVAGMRYFNVFGPNEYHKDAMASVIFRAFPTARLEGKVRLFESHKADVPHGEQKRDFIYIDEALAATHFLMEHRRVHGIFNVGTGQAHSFNELAKGIFDGLGVAGLIEYFAMPEEIRDRYQYFTAADMSRLISAGLTPFPDRFREHVAAYVRDFLLPGYRRWQDGPRVEA